MKVVSNPMDTNEVNYLISMSSTALNSTNYTESQKYAEKALVQATELDFKRGMADANSHIAICIGMGQNDKPNALKYHLEALKIRQEIGDKHGMAKSYHNIGLNYDSQGNYEKAMENQKASLNVCEVIGDKNGMARAFLNIGLIYNHQSNYNEALKSYLSSLKLYEESGDNPGVAKVYTNIGVIYKRKGNYPEALKYYLASLKIKEEIGDKSTLAVTYINIGNLYSLQSDYALALRYQSEALKIQEATNNKNLIALSYIHVASAHSGLRNDSEAFNYFMSALHIAHETGNKEIVASVSKSIGTLNANDCNYHEALKNFTTAFQIYQERNDKYALAHVCTKIGATYIHLNQTEEAKSYLMKGLTLSKEIGILTGIRDAYKGLTALDSMTGDFQQALEYYRLYNEYKDSLYNETNSAQIAQLKEQYESEKKDKEIQNLENEMLLSGLLLKTKQDSLNFAQSEKEKIQLENEKFFALNLFNQQQLELLGNEKKLQVLQSEKDKAEAGKSREQLALLSKEREVQELKLNKERLTKNYFIGGLGLFLVLSFFVYRNYQTKQELKMLALRNKIASDLHDDVGSTLSSISIFSQMAQAQTKEVIPALETIGESSRKMLDAMTDIVWTINPDNDQFEKIIMRMRTFAYELLGAKQIEYEFMIDEGASIIKLPMQARKNLYLIFKEATNNLVKYADASKAHFSIRELNKQLTMVIQDNGKGFDMEKVFDGNGLKNMKKRAEEIGGKLTVVSRKEQGTMITLSVAV